MNADILTRKRTSFLWWRLDVTDPPPELVLGEFGSRESRRAGVRVLPLERQEDFTDLWGISASVCALQDDVAYHYWFEVSDGRPEPTGTRVRITDPLAYAVDWRLRAESTVGAGDRDGYPGAVLRYQHNQLTTCDPEVGCSRVSPASGPRSRPTTAW